MIYKRGIFMFEEFDMPQDGNLYFQSVPEFEMLSRVLPVEEVGIHFSGEIPIDDKMSVLTDRKVSFSSVEETVHTYQKVMEVRELTQDEILKMNKWRLFLKKLFEVFFRNKKWRVYYTVFCGTAIAFDIASNNVVGIIIMSLAILLNTSPIQFAKELPKIFASPEKIERLKETVSSKEVF